MLNEQYKKYHRTKFQRRLPIISLSDIIEVLQDKFDKTGCNYKKEELWNQLSKYMQQNGLSFSTAKKVGQFSDKDRILISVAQLCNATSYLNYRCGAIGNPAVYEALDCLADKEIIRGPNKKMCKTEWYFFLYKTFCDTFYIHEYDLSPLAICKYCRLYSWPSLRKIDFFDKLYSMMVGVLISVKNEILSQFKIHSILEMEAYDEVLRLFCILKKYLLPKGDVKNFDTLEKFLENENNFTSSGFTQFLESEIGSWKNQKIQNHWKDGMIYELFSLTLDLIASILLEHMRQYCVMQLEWYTVKQGNKEIVTEISSEGGKSQ